MAWPEYRLTVEEVREEMAEVKMLDSTNTGIDQNFVLILRDILDQTNQ